MIGKEIIEGEVGQEFGAANPRITTETFSGEVRWALLSSVQAHRRKLQQRVIVTEYEGGSPVSQRHEWRDVPFVNE